MTVEIANALRGYFEALYDFNRNLIMCCGLDVIDNSGQYEKPIEELIQIVPRLVPYAFVKGDGEYKINARDGLIEFSDDIPFVLETYEQILLHHYTFLEKVKKIRDKFEHKMHGVQMTSGGSGSLTMFDVTYTIGENRIMLTASEFVSFAKEINIFFSKIQKVLEDFAFQNGKEDRRYYRRMLRYDFEDFNKIYDSGLVSVLGRALFPF